VEEIRRTLVSLTGASLRRNGGGFMSERAVVCPWCKQEVVVVTGAWTFERSQIVQHLGDCTRRPIEVAVAELNRQVDRMTDFIVGA
jgi:hypothetical protein